MDSGTVVTRRCPTIVVAAMAVAMVYKDEAHADKFSGVDENDRTCDRSVHGSGSYCR